MESADPAKEKSRPESVPALKSIMDQKAADAEAERKKRRREFTLIILAALLIVALTYAETRIIRFGAGIPVSNTILMFIVINLNMLLLITLVFLVIRNLTKLFVERRSKVLGSRLRGKLVLAFITLSIVPTVVIFFFSLQFIMTSMEFWFNVPVEQSLENSLKVGQKFYGHVEKNHDFFIERIAYQIRTRDLLEPQNKKKLRHYIRVTQRAFNLDGVQIYDNHSQPQASSSIPSLDGETYLPLSSDSLMASPPPDSRVRTVTRETSLGELIRTVGAVPYKSDRQDAQGFVEVTTLLPVKMSAELASISRGIEEYRQHQILKEPIKASLYVTLSIVALLVVFCAVWFGFYLAKSLTGPIAALAEGTRRVAGGDLAFTLDKSSDDEMGSLVEAFNRMTRDLLYSRQQLEYSAHQLAEQNEEIESRRRYMEVVLQNVSTGVISLDHIGRITTINKSAEKMLELGDLKVVGKDYKEVLEGQQNQLVTEITDRLIKEPGDFIRQNVRQTIGGRPKSFMVHLAALRDEKDRYMGMVIVFDDLTDLERAQRMAAWREVARRIAHEVKNPLTPIKLSAQRIARKYNKQLDDPVFTECTGTIISQVDLIRDLVNEFSTYARFPAPRPVFCDLGTLINDAVTPYKEGYDQVKVEVQAEEDLPRIMLDPQQIKRALINLLDNAIAAMNKEGSLQIKALHLADVKKVRLEVSDTGKGISESEKARLFEPYFSTKKAGMGLGLSIVNTIVTDHEGTIRVQDNEPTGARFVIDFPVK